jgi:DNA invertase Pin-like site-specific DNA recombinase
MLGPEFGARRVNHRNPRPGETDASRQEYMHVSTKDQSCDLQLRDLRTYCAARGFEPAREYIDVGQSGAKESRPELNKLMETPGSAGLTQSWCGGLIASHALPSIRFCRLKNFGRWASNYQENIDTSSPLGQALFTIVSAVAQLERDLIRERVSAGIRNARAMGRKFGRPMRSVDRDRILQMRGEGQSLRQIATNSGPATGRSARGS